MRSPCTMTRASQILRPQKVENCCSMGLLHTPLLGLRGSPVLTSSPTLGLRLYFLTHQPWAVTELNYSVSVSHMTGFVWGRLLSQTQPNFGFTKLCLSLTTAIFPAPSPSQEYLKVAGERLGDSTHCHRAGGQPRSGARGCHLPTHRLTTHSQGSHSKERPGSKQAGTSGGQFSCSAISIAVRISFLQRHLMAIREMRQEEVGGPRDTGMATEGSTRCPGHSRTSFGFSASCLNLSLPAVNTH